jgi:hypothetical protein
MRKLSPDLSSHDFVTPPMSCLPLYVDQAMRSTQLVAMLRWMMLALHRSRGATSPEVYKSLG